MNREFLGFSTNYHISWISCKISLELNIIESIILCLFQIFLMNIRDFPDINFII